MKFKTLLILSLAGLFLASCKKGDGGSAADTFPHKVYMNGVTAKGNLRVFANGAEITDQNVINKFVSVGDKAAMVMRLPKDTATITFLASDKAYYNTYTQTIVKNGSDLMFSFMMSGISTSDLDINFGMLKHPPVIQNLGGNGIRYNVNMVASGDFANLSVAFFGYKLFRKSLFLTTYAQAYDEFNPAVAAKLGSTDTLAIQEYTINFKAR